MLASIISAIIAFLKAIPAFENILGKILPTPQDKIEKDREKIDAEGEKLRNEGRPSWD